MTRAIRTRLLKAIQEADVALGSTDIHDILDALDLAKEAMLAAVGETKCEEEQNASNT